MFIFISFSRSAITESSRYITYERDGRVNRPEVGTYAEDDWVTTKAGGPDGEDLRPNAPGYEAKVATNRMKVTVNT